MANFGFGGGFGAPSSSPFGTTSPSPFGQQAPAFGQSTSPFGATTTTSVFGQSAPAFGATPAPAFGAQPAPAFGASSTPAFGAASAPAFGAAPTGAFGQAKPAFGGFGAAAASPFGAAPTAAPAFGASAPAFGAASAPAFGASPFGGGTSAFGASPAPAFGAASAPAFGAASTPAFGQGLSAFGSTAFGGGATPAAGGFGTPGFGGGARGTRAVQWRKTQEQDSSGNAGAKTGVVYFNSISCMPEYASKSVEELRWEDYADGCKGNTGAASPASGAFGASTFGASTSSPFGAPTSSPAFGASSAPAFGASAPAFGAAPAPAFGTFGAQSAPAFGAASQPAFGGFGAASPSPFGGSSPSPFGQSAPAFGASSAPAFGAASQPAFGAASAPAFGAASQPAFGGFGAASASGFGASPAPAFGAASQPAFGFASSAPTFGAASTSGFGATSAPAFGFGAASTPGFGAQPAPAFGASSASLFGASSTPAFGGTSLFGGTQQQQQQQKPAGGFGFGAASTPGFGASPAPAFGASSSSLFGGGSAPAFGANPFGGSQAAPAFTFAPAQPSSMPAGTMMPAQPMQAPGVATSPYGVLPEAPKMSPAPEYKVGLTQRPAGLLAGGTPRPAALITPRSLTPRSGVRMRPRHGMSASHMTKSPADFLSAANGQAGGGTPGSAAPGGSTTPNGSVFVPRENPRRLFVRDRALPSTEAAASISASPSSGGGGGSTPGPSSAALRTPAGSGLRVPPGRRADLGASGSGDVNAVSGGGGFSLPENGFGPQGGSGGQGGLSDAQLASLLPSLKQPDYHTEPSLQQLAAMAREDPSSLAAVSNFSVVRRGVGSVRWLEPTDVRGLDLDTTVQLSKGSIEVYLDERLKPEVGQGLNKRAEVTMLRIHRLDKATGKPTTDPEAIDRFARKLKKLTADQGARFVSYDAAAGTWRFEVEHFSKYGLLDSDEEDGGEAAGSDEDMAAYGLRGKAAAGAQQQQQQKRRQPSGGEAGAGAGAARWGQAEMEEAAAALEADGMEGDGYGDDDAMLESQGRGGGGSAAWPEGEQEVEEESEGQELSLGGGGAFGGDDGGGAGRALQLSLPAQLGMDPEDLQRIRDGLYAGSQANRQQPATQQRVAASGGGFGTVSQQHTAAPPPAAAFATVPAQPVLAARNAWRKQQSMPFKPPAAAKARQAVRRAGPPLLPAGPTLVTAAAASKQCLVPAPAAAAAGGGSERCLPDAGLFAGASFRANWAPNAVFVHAGGRASSASHVVVSQAIVGARVAPAGQPAGADSAFQQRQRSALQAALDLHLKHSSPDAQPSTATATATGGDADMADGGELVPAAPGVPQWRLCCRRQGDLRQLTQQYKALCNAAADKAEGVERGVLAHQAATWELMHVLFSAIEGEQLPASAGGGGGGNLSGSSGNGGEDQGGEDGHAAAADAAMDAEELRLDKLAAFKRRAHLSHWLRDQARPQVKAEALASYQPGPAAASDSVAARLLALLSGHQLSAAAVLAACSGNVRLATLLAQAGTKGVGQAELAQQLQTWQETGCDRHISTGLRHVYQLLAGQVEAVTPSLNLDWRRALGLHLWYGCQPTASVAEALAAYTAAVEAGAAPPPLPLYAERGGGVAACGRSFDVAFELLRLHAVACDPDASGSVDMLRPLLARLLRPSGVTPDPLDYSFCWHMLGVLQALQVLPAAATALPEAAVASMSFISQLEASGQLSHWAVYAALHLPDAAERGRVVRELLAAHADEWCDDEEVQAFFRQRLGLPAAWLAQAQALWAQYCEDDAGRLDHLLAAEDWPAAHTLLCDTVAPRWLLAGATQRLSAVLQQLEPHAAVVGLAAGAGAWEAGGGCYSSYLFLKDLYATLGLGSTSSGGRAAAAASQPALSFHERMDAAARLSAMLEDAAARWGLAGPEQDAARRLDAGPGGGAARQAVYARMSAEVSKWVLSDSEGNNLRPLPEQDRLALGMRAMPYKTAAAGLQMAAIHLAQRVA
ncbi:hypothetical protein D9Q98_001175 [Chlorella vulgaris]|uniref:Peptidase S59 domain-containing protein n=1 Tax=Chlorella vulgaris TaxID=3077 RepID=A0A9D4Z2S4_CHLVU|nr:hypothetical protein D9Q98_001175 [Chlorella vulgaris]